MMANTFETDGVSSSTAEPPTSFHGWNPLPTELKLEVMSYIFLHMCPVNYKRHIVNAKSHQSNLLPCLFPTFRTRNRELANLAQYEYYKYNTFLILLGIMDCDRNEWQNKAVPPGIRYPRAAVAGMIRRIRVTAQECNV
jgi:hypothetical protein